MSYQIKITLHDYTLLITNLQEMREIESSRGPPLLGPGIADLASAHSAGAWAEEYLASEAQMRVSATMELYVTLCLVFACSDNYNVDECYFVTIYNFSVIGTLLWVDDTITH